jgi:hypothetical protein
MAQGTGHSSHWGDCRRPLKYLLQKLACGDFSHIAIGKLASDEITYLRSVAIDALAGIGDQRTLSLLQRQDDWSNPELQAASHRARESIAWRLFERSHSCIASLGKHE